MGRYRAVPRAKRPKAYPQVNPVDDWSDPSISFWPNVESEEGKDTGILDQHGHPILWFPDQIGFVRDDDE